MSDRTDVEPSASLAAAWGWHVRPASPEEAPVVAAAARALLRELDATPPAPDAMEAAARTLIADRDAGEVFLADAGGAIVGMLAASWQIAIHIPGRYGLIQDLWVHRDWRSQAVGHGLVDALVTAARQHQVTRIEVGVPRDGWPHLEATRRFYLRNGFGTIGGRLRREPCDVTQLVMVTQRRRDGDDAAPWIVDGGRRMRGHDHDRRLAALEEGLWRHARVSAIEADASDADVERVLAALHEPTYLDALRDVRRQEREPALMPAFTAPGLEPDIPVGADLVAAAHEGVRTAITAAQRVAAGARFAYALCRPPGHHAGPAWLGGYCYLNTAAAATQTLLDAGAGPVGILDLDLHYPNGTSAIVAQMDGAELHSLHAWPVTNAPEDPVLPRTEREALIEFRTAPDAASYLEAVGTSVATLARSARALVLSLGYDTVAGDPHGSWSFEPDIFSEIGRLLAASGLPICVIQEGGYALETLADCSHAFATGLLEEHAA